MSNFPAHSLRQLVRSAVLLSTAHPDRPAADCAARVNSQPGKQVIFDMDIDGSRYILIRAIPLKRTSCPVSPRELQVVRRVAAGQQNKVIAASLNISAWTVCTHLRRIFAKMEVNSRAAMVARAAQSGVSLPDFSNDGPRQLLGV